MALTIDHIYKELPDNPTPNLPHVAHINTKLDDPSNTQTVFFTYDQPSTTVHNQTYDFLGINAEYLDDGKMKHNVVNDIKHAPLNGVLHNYNFTINEDGQSIIRDESHMEQPFQYCIGRSVNNIITHKDIKCTMAHRGDYRGMGTIRGTTKPDFVVYKGLKTDEIHGEVLVPIEFKLSFKIFSRLLKRLLPANELNSTEDISAARISKAHAELLELINPPSPRITVAQTAPLRNAIIQLVKYMMSGGCRYGVLDFYYCFTIVDIGFWPPPQKHWDGNIGVGMNNQQPYVPIKMSIFYDGKVTTHAITSLVLTSPKVTEQGLRDLQRHYIEYTTAQLRGKEHVQRLYDTMNIENSRLRTPTSNVTTQPPTTEQPSHTYIQSRILPETRVTSPSLQSQTHTSPSLQSTSSEGMSSTGSSPVKPTREHTVIDCSELYAYGYDQSVYTEINNIFDRCTNLNLPHKIVLSGTYAGQRVYIKIFNRFHYGVIELNTLRVIIEHRSDNTKLLYEDTKCVELIAGKQFNQDCINHNFTGEQPLLYKLLSDKTVIITKPVDMYEPLHNLNLYDNATKKLIHTQLYNLIDALNESKIFYTDIHSGNIFYDTEKKSIYLIDFDSVRFTTVNYFFGDREIDESTVLLEQRQKIDDIVYNHQLADTCEQECNLVKLICRTDNTPLDKVQSLLQTIQSWAYTPPE